MNKKNFFGFSINFLYCFLNCKIFLGVNSHTRDTVCSHYSLKRVKQNKKIKIQSLKRISVV